MFSCGRQNNWPAGRVDLFCNLVAFLRSMMEECLHHCDDVPEAVVMIIPENDVVFWLPTRLAGPVRRVPVLS